MVNSQQVYLVLIWYICSTGLSFLNRSLGKEFHLPLYITSFHMLIHSIIAHVLTKKTPKMPPTKVIPTAVSTAGDIGASNMALVHVTVGFYTIVKSSVPLFVLLFAVFFKLEKISIKLCLMIFIITCGLILAVWRNANFNGIGFLLLMIAVVLAGLRWSLTQILMTSMKSPLHAMRHLSPLMSLLTFFAALIVNPIAPNQFSSEFPLARVISLTFLGSILAFCLTLSEFRLLQITSVLTVSIFGIIKELLTISLDSILEKEQTLTPINVVGLFICIAGIIWYHLWKNEITEDQPYSPLREIFVSEELSSPLHPYQESSPKKRHSLEMGSPIYPERKKLLQPINKAFLIEEADDIELNEFNEMKHTKAHD
eukprot:NODE_3_length_80033_cov_0.932970.p18 type:complete len:369 gc:universal NODE_3_length_80033_cov_0.932970:35421-36527(+)